ncbi:MAG: iron-sulfur cluster assembly protein, partial [Burkholderiales bacterium]
MNVSTVSDSQIKSALQEISDPNTGRDLMAGKIARNIKIEGDDIALDLVFGYPAKNVMDGLRKQVISRLKKIPGAGNVSVNAGVKIVSHSVQRGVKLIPNVKNIIAVASGKG